MTDSAETERRTLVLNCCALLATSAAVSMSSRELVTSWCTELCRWADRAVFSAMSCLLEAVDRSDRTLRLIFELGEFPRVVCRRRAKGGLERDTKVAPDLLQR